MSVELPVNVAEFACVKQRKLGSRAAARNRHCLKESVLVKYKEVVRVWEEVVK